MAIAIPLPQAKTYELAPAGSLLGALYSVVDMGSQPYSFGDDAGIRRQVRLSFETVSELMFDGRPFNVARTYGFSWHPLSTFRQHIESWVGHTLNEEEARSFDLAGQIGAVAVLGIVHVTGTNGARYANLTQLLHPPAGVNPRHKLINRAVVISPATFNEEIYRSQPTWLQKRLVGAPEYRVALKGGGPSPEQLGDRLRKKLASSPRLSTGKDLDDDSIPF